MAINWPCFSLVELTRRQNMPRRRLTPHCCRRRRRRRRACIKLLRRRDRRGGVGVYLQAGNSGCINGRAPRYLAEFCRPCVDRRPGMRSADSRKLHVPRTQTSFGDRSFAIAGPRTWNNLPDAIRDSSLSFLTFAKLLKSYLFV